MSLGSILHISPKLLVGPWIVSYALIAYLSISDIATTSWGIPKFLSAIDWLPYPVRQKLQILLKY